MASSNQEQYLLELTNEARLDPLANAARYIASYDPLTAKQGDIQDAAEYFGVSGPDLLAAYTALTPAQPLAWNDSLTVASRQHDRAMIAADEQSHQLPGERVFTDRDADAGYAFTNRAAENVYAYAHGGLYTQAGFMIDWGNSEPGHRDNIMDPALREVGIGILANTNSDSQFGPQVVTEDFGSHGTSGSFLLGVAYTDSDHDAFYSVGEGVAGLTVSVAGASATSSASGGYTLATNATGHQTVTLTGGNLPGAVSVGLDLQNQNIKLDVVGGNTLLTSASVSVEGPVATIQGLGLTGLTITAGAGSHGIVGTPGGDTLTGGSDADQIAGRQGNDVIVGRQGNDTLGGGQGQDAIGGGQGDDQLRGGAGADTLRGGQGNDLLFGGQDNDALFGGQGNDSLAGGMGDDTLTGGLGADRFVFGFTSGHDLITDFSGGGDTLDLQGQSYSLGTATDGFALLTLSGGGSIQLAGLTAGQVDLTIFA